ncbi:TPA: hypothetical protein HIQ38_003311, partial [Escherichia coli]|nr:hypothetical protein [Escherichia coli]HAH9180739.1 hypothetical protein [Escherichia coli]HAH9185359.1 hypothetical protein [Escherichia coli]HAH9208022.1 hypothetical protein [Escherichia coli]HAH9426563.1 hypothetical protein [Escherichia coli]
ETADKSLFVVFPAPAGINRPSPTRSGATVSVPRASGDKPGSNAL